MHPITLYRRAKGLTQADLAQQVGVTLNAVQAWEHGARPRPRIMPKLADVLGVDSTDLEREIAGWRDVTP